MYVAPAADDVMMEIPVLVRKLKSSILTLNSFQLDNTFWQVLNADPKIPPKQIKKKIFNTPNPYGPAIPTYIFTILVLK